MKKTFSVSEAARLVGVTAETLRHYDRIGLAPPSIKDEWTKYRRYTEQDVIRLGTVSAMRSMGMSLVEIKNILGMGDLGKIAEGFGRALARADEKIRELTAAKERISRAKRFYESKLAAAAERADVREFPARTILLSPVLTRPTLEDLHDYHRHFFAQLGGRRDEFAFEDEAGVYCTADGDKMFAVCSKFADADGLIALPAGRYLCAECTDENSDAALEKLLNAAKNEYSAAPSFALRMVRLTGILQWKYELQVPICE